MDESGNPLYGDVFGQYGDGGDSDEEVEKGARWGALEPEVEESEEEEEEEAEEEGAEGGKLAWEGDVVLHCCLSGGLETRSKSLGYLSCGSGISFLLHGLHLVHRRRETVVRDL